MPMNLNSNRAAPASQGCEMRHGISSTVTVTVTVASQTADTRISSSNLYRQARAAPGPALHDLKAFKLPPDPGPSLVNWKLEHLQTVAGTARKAPSRAPRGIGEEPCLPGHPSRAWALPGPTRRPGPV
jgi:hypothetical protein